MMKILALIGAIAAVAGGAAYWQWPERLAWLGSSGNGEAVAYVTAEATRGDVRRVVSSSGPVGAVVTVLVGSQLSGQIEALNADFNSEVRSGDVLARIDPKTFERRVAQARADVAAAKAALLVREANLAKAKAVLSQAEKAVQRNRTLSAKKLTPEANLESAQRDASVARADISVTEAEIASAKATVAQRQAALDQAEIDLERTFIRAPIDGIVISRTIDLGQTVAASLQAPELFQIAQDLSRIRIEAQVNEADIGNVATGNPVTFTVDAFPDRSFAGQVSQVRLAATEIQNVVTYTVIIDAANDGRRLYPGMTANVVIETGIAGDVLRVPNEALRFRPKDAAAGGGGQRGGSGRLLERMSRTIDRVTAEIGLSSEQAAALRNELEAAVAELRPQGGGLTAQADPRRMGEQLSARIEKAVAGVVNDEQRSAFERWRRERDSARNATVYVLGAGGQPEPRFVRLGLSDETSTEVKSGELKEGERLILRLDLRAAGS
jgi:HlyD family secretion protein